MITTNYLIIGSGVAGLTLAIKLAERFPKKQITLITKSTDDESNTKYAQGGIAIVLNEKEDSYQKHIQDTLVCGDGLCDESVVQLVVRQGPQRLKELIEWGAQFDKNTKGNFDLGKEGGHSQNRVVHHKDQTGYEIERAILEQAHQKENISILDHHFALDLIAENQRCYGAHVLYKKNKKVTSFYSDFTILATGGIGHLYGHTTNPVIATGDGIAMAHRANASITDMEFIQFHPTALYDNATDSKFLISEAVRGFGAYLRTKTGTRFMLDYDHRGELASRDIVSQSIDLELKKSGDDYVYLDCTHLDLEAFKNHFPMIYTQCKNRGIDVSKDWIPVVPAQHYLCGGIVVDQNGKTTVENLLACGECSRTGLHGANRLASNSLLEALVYSDAIFHFLAETASNQTHSIPKTTSWNFKNKPEIDSAYLQNTKTQLHYLMRQNAGIVRNQENLIAAQEKLLQLQNDIKAKIENHQINVSLYELNNMVTTGLLIVQQSINRNENRGGFMKLKPEIITRD
jgi:L-aspartate oxidase